MSERRLVDTNLIVRYLVQDNERQAKTAGKLFDACDRGDVVTKQEGDPSERRMNSLR